MAANEYAGTQTEKNLQEAFAGESQARNKYTYFASVAKKEGQYKKVCCGQHCCRTEGQDPCRAPGDLYFSRSADKADGKGIGAESGRKKKK